MAMLFKYKTRASTLLEIIVASVIILISYGYFIVTYIQLNKPNNKKQQIQTYYEQQFMCDSIMLQSERFDKKVGVYEIGFKSNFYNANYISVSKEGAPVHLSYKSFLFSK